MFPFSSTALIISVRHGALDNTTKNWNANPNVKKFKRSNLQMNNIKNSGKRIQINEKM